MAYTLISSADVSGVSDITINNIPGTHKTLILDIRYFFSNDNGVAIRFNNDISSYFSVWNHTSGSGRGLADTAATAIGYIQSSTWNRTILKIPDYASTGKHGFSSFSGSSNTPIGIQSGGWDGGAAITRIDFSPFSNSSITISYELWGLS